MQHSEILQEPKEEEEESSGDSQKEDGSLHAALHSDLATLQ